MADNFFFNKKTTTSTTQENNSASPETLLPPILIDYYLKESGIDLNSDPEEQSHLKNCISNIATKIIDELIENCTVSNKLNSRTKAYNTQAIGSNASNNPKLSIYQFKVMEKTEDDLKKTLTMKDVSTALEKMGLNSEKPDFYL
ncbi:Transcription initiation factor TFIID subunit 10 [Cucumispora dikerogammari]|nr:Transcription initiation factor TFIID subunit 10 [Cucumispora dikerogammari]